MSKSNKNYLYGAAALVALLYLTRKGITMTAQSDLDNPNVKAFLNLIKKHESRGGDYSIIYGGGQFTDFSAHPNKRVPFMNPKTKQMDYSTAAGAYQINWKTWLEINAVMSLPDFGKQSQDLAAIILLRKIGALPLIIAGDLNGALQKASGRWASLPYSTSMQNKTSTIQAQADYLGAGGRMA